MNRFIYIPEKAILLVLIVFVSITTVLSGLLMMTRPGGTLISLPLQLFDENYFQNYFVPGFILSMVAGNTNLLALIFIIEKDTKQYNLSIAGGLMVLVWVVAHMYITQQFHWLQLVYIGIGVAMTLLSINLKSAVGPVKDYKI